MRRRWIVAAGFAFAYLYAFPYFDALRSANELPRVLTTQQIVDHGTFRLDGRLGELGSTFDVATTPAPHAHAYSNKAPGPSLLAVPAYLACKALGATSIRACTWAFRVTAVTIPALIFLPFFFWLTRRFAGDGADGEAARRTALVAYALGSLAFPYALLFLSHDLAACFAGGAFVAAVALCRGETKRADLAAVAAGFLAGGAVLMDYQAVIAAFAVGVYLIVRAPQRLRHAALAAAGAMPPALALAAYHRACFGSALKTGYSFAADPANHQGFHGIIGPNRIAMWNALLAPSNGLLIMMPWVLLAVAGGVAIARDRAARARVGAEAIVCASVLVAYVLFLGSLVPEFGRAGWSVGPRYITVAMPFTAWLATAGFAFAERRTAARAAAQGLVLASVTIFAVAATTYPHWPEYLKNPLYELSFRVLRSGHAVHSLGTAIGLSGMGAIVPLFTIVAVLAVTLLTRRPQRDRVVSTCVACALAAGIVMLYATFPRDRAAADKSWKFVDRTWEPR